MIHRWDLLTFLHWSYEPSIVQRLLPDGLTVDTYQGRAWVGLVPFLMRVRPASRPKPPWIATFCETNVRTYATAPDGTRGVWFFSLDASHVPAVLTGRVGYRLPYYRSTMQLVDDDNTVSYTCRRRWPRPAGASSSVSVRVCDRYEESELTDFDHYLTARWRLYAARGHGLRYALAQHEPWPLHRVDVLHVDDQLVAAAGLPAPEGVPVAHWSPGVEVRIGLPGMVTTSQSGITPD